MQASIFHRKLTTGTSRLAMLTILASGLAVPVPVYAQTDMTSPIGSSSAANNPAGGQAGRQSPAVISDAAGSTYIGSIGGLDGWTIPGSDAVFFTAPDGRTTIVGFAFAPDGTDVGAQYSGHEPAELEKILQGQADIEANRAVEAESEEPGSSPSASVASPVQTGAAEPDGVTPEEREQAQALVQELIVGIRDAETPEEFQQTFSAWLKEIPEDQSEAVHTAVEEAQNAAGLQTPQKIDDGSTSSSNATTGTGKGARRAPAAKEGSDSDREPAETAKTEPAADQQLPVTLAPTGTVESSAAEGGIDAQEPTQTAQAEQAKPAATQPTAENVLDSFRTESFWFQVGKMDAPVVYALIDPECPFCARSMLNLQKRVEGGELQLRVALVPVLSDRSAGTIAAIFSDAEPPVKFWEHEIDKAYGQSKLAPVTDIEGLAEKPKFALQATGHNFNLAKKYGITGVPFFAWNTAEGAKMMSGVAKANSFDDAVADDYGGNLGN